MKQRRNARAAGHEHCAAGDESAELLDALSLLAQIAASLTRIRNGSGVIRDAAGVIYTELREQGFVQRTPKARDPKFHPVKAEDVRSVLHETSQR